MTLVGLSLASSAWSGGNINIRLEDSGEGGAGGLVRVIDEADGPDVLSMRVRGLEPDTLYTFFLTQSPTLGALPAQFVGEFTTDERGIGKLFAITEVVNAYASANEMLDDDRGVADTVAAGALQAGANTIALDWMRVYVGSGDLSVFGRSDAEVGGGLALNSTRSLP